MQTFFHLKSNLFIQMAIKAEIQSFFSVNTNDPRYSQSSYLQFLLVADTETAQSIEKLLPPFRKKVQLD